MMGRYKKASLWSRGGYIVSGAERKRRQKRGEEERRRQPTGTQVLYKPSELAKNAELPN